MISADKLRDLRYDEWPNDAAVAVIAAAERSCDAYTREAEDWNDGEFALWSKDDLVEAIVAQRSALAALNARLTDTRDGGVA